LAPSRGAGGRESEREIIGEDRLYQVEWHSRIGYNHLEVVGLRHTGQTADQGNRKQVSQHFHVVDSPSGTGAIDV
jgi:hypothetical protein